MDVSEAEDVLSGPATPPRDNDEGDVGGGVKDGLGRGRKRQRRAKGKKKKQKTCLMITNDDGTDSTTREDGQQKKKVYLRPSNNPLLKAPKNSTQFIIDDHENSNLFWNFDAHPETDRDPEGQVLPPGEDSHPPHNQGMAVLPGQFFGVSDCDRLSPDDDTFWAQYSERDFESVYETAHQEEVYSWEKSKILEEITVLEVRQKQLIDLLSQIDPLIYLEKLQHELLDLQEQNRKLKLINIAERLERQQRGGRSATGSPRLPDSTSRETGDSSETSSESSDEEGGCGSGCCLADVGEERMEEVRDEEDEPGQVSEQVEPVEDEAEVNVSGEQLPEKEPTEEKVEGDVTDEQYVKKEAIGEEDFVDMDSTSKPVEEIAQGIKPQESMSLNIVDEGKSEDLGSGPDKADKKDIDQGNLEEV